eukprot:TRINITY_DN3360_c0_g1_i2.p1 TRINITY_DN3360_c0_g1~~TRINITY_DN3360_c0_g1_i2.p1  ORF type:complete len:649 (-),score=113.62 TRINITY_DN3360_c0_g1_i2:48-1928(-)
MDYSSSSSSTGERDRILINSKNRKRQEQWEFAGYGKVSNMDGVIEDTNLITEKPHQLGQVLATAISGNDITSSCLYVAGIVITTSGIFAPISLLMVAFVLYLFRNVYGEVGSALPLNGGAYNILLNTTTKFVATIAAILTLLSYIATAVVSASEAVEYAHTVIEEIPVLWGTIILLGIFALLNIMGIGESAVVALVIFVIHILTLTALVFICGYHWIVNVGFDTLLNNFEATWKISVPSDIFLGFCSGLLGVSGFETSANFIEEQKPGVFPKTLRNMWVAVTIFNPLIALIGLSIIPLDQIVASEKTFLATMGTVSAGKWLGIWVSIDATLVLSGAVLTSYVGVIGLVHRMTLDRVLPNFLLQKNSCRRTTHWIIIMFFLVTSALYLMVQENVTTLSAVYTVAFLSVMCLFAIGNMLLKYKRSDLPRDIKAKWWAVVLALGMCGSALVGNMMNNPSMIEIFFLYFSVGMAIAILMLARLRVLRILFNFLSKTFLARYLGGFLKQQIKEIKSTEMVFFTRKGELEVLNKGILYVSENELTNKLKIVHCYDEEQGPPANIVENVKILDETYPKMRIDLVLVCAEFSPDFVNYLSAQTGIQKNFMFIACPGSSFPHNIGAFGGVRLITH